MMITKENYFDFISKIGIENLTEGAKEMHDLINQFTEGGKDWSIYPSQKENFDAQFRMIEKIWNKRNEPKKNGEAKHEEKEAAKKTVLPKVKHEQPQKTFHKERVVHKEHRETEAKQEHDSHSEHIPRSRQVSHNAHPPVRLPEVKVKGREVPTIDPEVTFIKRFALLHGKVKTKDQILSFIKTIQRAITEQRITKKSKHAKTINEIQGWLVNTFKKMGNEKLIRFENKNLIRFLKIAKSEHILPSVRFIKRFIGMKAKPLTKEKAKDFNDAIFTAVKHKIISAKDKYYKQLKAINAVLHKYYFDKSGKEVLEVSPQVLSGLEGVLKSCGCNSVSGYEYEETFNDEDELSGVETDDGVMSVNEARKMEFRPVPLTGEYLKLIGKMCLPTHFLVYGLGGSGKSSFVLLFTQYLNQMGYKILYVAKEQYGTPTFTDMLNRLNIEASDSYKIVKSIDKKNPEKNPANYDFVVLDSKDDMNLDLDSFGQLKSEFPQQSFIMISQGTKDGDFTGTGRWRNAVDVMVFAEDGIIKTGMDKNRWGGAGEMNVFER